MVCIATQYLAANIKPSVLAAGAITKPCQGDDQTNSCPYLYWQILCLQESLAATREELQTLKGTAVSMSYSSSVVDRSTVMKRYSYSPLMQLTFKAISYLVWLIIGLAIALSLGHMLKVLVITDSVIGFVAMLLKPLAVIVLSLIAITVFKESL
ncbi:MAG: hypothetical protein ACFB2W_26365 [Leptolyngbyaceae cyanobacterium]